MKLFQISLLLILMLATPVFAGEADVIAVEMKHIGNNVYQFNVTIRHNDEGWKHYADKWEVISPDGKLIASRILHHPHVNEQPFTRSLPGVKISEGIEKVIIRSHDSVHEYGGKEMTVKLQQ